MKKNIILFYCIMSMASIVLVASEKITKKDIEDVVREHIEKTKPRWYYPQTSTIITVSTVAAMMGGALWWIRKTFYTGGDALQTNKALTQKVNSKSNQAGEDVGEKIDGTRRMVHQLKGKTNTLNQAIDEHHQGYKKIFNEWSTIVNKKIVDMDDQIDSGKEKLNRGHGKVMQNYKEQDEKREKNQTLQRDRLNNVKSNIVLLYNREKELENKLNTISSNIDFQYISEFENTVKEFDQKETNILESLKRSNNTLDEISQKKINLNNMSIDEINDTFKKAIEFLNNK